MTMNPAAKKNPLGKGLSALLGPDIETESSERLMYIESDLITLSNYQARKRFDEKSLAELAASIREVGILQPLVVRRVDSDSFELIAGERRLRASIIAGLKEVPVIVKEFDDKKAFEAALIENIQRSDLSPIEEAVGYQQFIDEFDYTQDQLSNFIGKSRSYIANTLRLLNLPEKIRGYVHDGLITPGHARALLTSGNADTLVEHIIAKKLNVRQAEALARKKDNLKEPLSPVVIGQDDDIVSLQEQLSTILKSDVHIRITGHKGHIEIEFKSLEELDELITRLSKIAEAGSTNYSG
jgi:ParB family transcriptional regulator, chromosome partitioning protein